MSTTKKLPPTAEPLDARHPAHPEYDGRAGTFYVLGTRRVHESDLTSEERAALGLPALPEEPDHG